MVIWLWAGRSPSLAIDTINVSCPSPAPFYVPVAMAVHKVFFREQNLKLKLIVTRAEVDRVTPIGEVSHSTKKGMLKDLELEPLVDDHSPPASTRRIRNYPQLFDFRLLQ